MNVLFARDSQDQNRITLHFPCELPVLVVSSRPHPWSMGVPWQLSRTTHVASFANRLARANIGKFAVELTDHRKSFCDFVEELLAVPGFVRLVHGDRYSLSIDVGRCFPTRTVCQAVADRVARHFYPEETAVVHPVPGGESRSSVVENPAFILTPRPHA